MSNIYIRDQCIPVASIKEAKKAEDIPYFSRLTPYFQAAVTFCWQWHIGQSTFEIHTSGSTGTPKPITISRRQMQASARMTINMLQLQANDTALVCLNTAYIAGKMMLVRALEAGMDILITTPDSLPFAQVPEDITIGFTAMVPMQVHATLESDNIARFNQLKALLVGGAPVSYPLQQAIARQINAPVYATYGMTETVSHIALRQLNGSDAYYTVLQGICIATDERSCLTIQGEVTNQKKLITNDIVELIDQRHFRWIGRADHVINSGGYKVFPEKVEAAIARIMHQASIQRAFIIGSIPDDRLGSKIVLLLEGGKLSTEQHERLQSSMATQLHPYECPKSVLYVPEFIMTSTGKIKREATFSLI